MRTLVLLFALTLPCLAQPLSPHDPAFLQSTSPLRRGLAAYWRLEEASGTRYDCSQYGNHLTDNNSVGQTTGKQGNAATFVTGSFQSLTKSSPTFTLTNFTILGWAFVTAGSEGRFVSTMINDATTDGMLLIQSSSQLQLWLAIGGAKTNVVTSGVFGDSAWYFFAGWYDGTNQYVQLNNDTVYSKATFPGATINSSVVRLGVKSAEGNFMTGYLDEVGVWTRVLTAAERTQLYNAGLGTHFPWAHP